MDLLMICRWFDLSILWSRICYKCDVSLILEITLSIPFDKKPLHLLTLLSKGSIGLI